MPIKVLHLISNKYGIGGAEKFLLDMSEEFDTDRFSVSYCNVFSAENNIFLKEIRKRKFECFEVKGTSWTDLPKMVRQLVSFMRREQFDVVHTQLLHGSIVGQLGARLAGVPVRVITRQYTNDCYHQGHTGLRNLDAFVARQATKVIAISNAVRNDLLEQGVHSDRIELIYNGISLKPFDQNGDSSELRDAFPGKYLIAFVANLNQRKGHEYLLRAMAQLTSQFKDIHLLLIGEGDLRTKLENLTAQLKLENNVSFLGHQENVPVLLKEIDLYVHASVLEPLGIAILEAMAAGKCVVATAVGGVPEIIEHGQTGFLVASKDIEGMVKAISYARENPKLIQEVANAGREHVEKNFSIQAIVKKYQELYEASFNSMTN